MSDGTKIEWTDATWNPIRARSHQNGTLGWHCERVSPGCQHCYAELLNHDRFGTGLGYNRPARDRVTIELNEAALTKPLHWKKPRRVFVCSMTDLFGEWVPDEVVDRVFAVMALSPQHTFQVLTKRPARMREYMTSVHEDLGLNRQGAVQNQLDFRSTQPRTVIREWPLPNVWLGTSVEDQERADQRIPELLATPAAVRFLSCEPLLGPVVLRHCNGYADCQLGDAEGHSEKPFGGIDWVIVGGESGPGARPFSTEWLTSIIGQCRSAGVACFVKQLGSYPRMTIAEWNQVGTTTTNFRLRDRKGGDMSEWPEDLRVREMPR